PALPTRRRTYLPTPGAYPRKSSSIFLPGSSFKKVISSRVASPGKSPPASRHYTFFISIPGEPRRGLSSLSRLVHLPCFVSTQIFFFVALCFPAPNFWKNFSG